MSENTSARFVPAPGRFLALVSCVCLGTFGTVEASPGSAQEAETLSRKILTATGIQGGLIVHVGCGDGRLTAALRASDGYLVHGLDASAENVEAARKHIRSLGLYGNVSVERFRGHRLPYIDNFVNLLVSEDLGDVPTGEVMRVLAPGGVAYINAGGQWTKTVKPRPKEIDDWTHYLHGPSNNAVAQDTVVGPPKHLQWVGSPPWARHHDHMASTSAMVSAGGRIFYIFDEGPTSAIQLPPVWSLIARDAFNGTILWRRKLDPWHTQLWLLKSGPALLPRRLVAVEDTVYVTLGLDGPLVALDAATGETIRTYQRTKGTEEVLFCDGSLVLLVNENPTARPWSTVRRYEHLNELRAEPEQWAWKTSPRAVMAIDARSGNLLWKKQSAVVPMTLAADATRVFFHDGTKIVCLARADGRQRWASEPIGRAPAIRSWFAPTLVVYQDVVLFAGGERITRHRGGKDSMTALSATSGKVLWTAPHPPSGYDSPEDLMVVGGLVWTAPMTNRADSGMMTGRDPLTGEIKAQFPADDGLHMPHHRCHRAKATEKYILASRTGIEYVDLRAEHWNRNDWVRGSCLYGIMPANGLTYAPTHSCGCYILSKLNGFSALAPARKVEGENPKAKAGPRLERGPAFGQIQNLKSEITNPSDWPTYRHDAARSGRTKTPLPVRLQQGWQTHLGGKLSAVVVAGGRAFVASVDDHSVHALDADSGRKLWSYTTGGRVDSPPTIWQGLALFGSADGWVYCLRASDGELVWRFRAAPAEMRLAAFEQIESAWPLHGSVLVREGQVYCVAGRSMFLDGGMRLVRLDARSGKKLSETILDNRHPATGKPLDANVKWPNLPVALPDVLSCDGQYIYMRSQRFDLAGRRTQVVAATDAADQRGEGAHLFSHTGFLDDTWWHRTYWMYGKTSTGGAGGWYRAAYNAPAGRIMVFDEQRVYAFGRKPQYFPRTTTMEYHLFAAGKQPEIAKFTSSKRDSRRGPGTRPVVDWSVESPLLGRALVLAGHALLVAGPPDVVDMEVAQLHIDDTATHAKLAEQVAAIEGGRGGLLRVVSAADGKKLAEYPLKSPPVFDGMAAAGGKLYLALIDGSILCFGGE